MKILFLAHLFPLPLDSGGKIKSYHTLKALAKRHEVFLLSYIRNEEERLHISELQRVCPRVELIPLKRSKLTHASDIISNLTLGRSFIVNRDFRPEMLDAFQKVTAAFNPDVVHIDHLQMAQFVSRDGSYKTVLDHHNVESSIIQRMAQSSDNVLIRTYARTEWPKLQRYELEACQKCDLVITVSEEDKTILQDLDSAIKSIHSVPIGVDVDYFIPVERNTESKNILSIGTMYWPPNVDSMLYFYHGILPLIKKSIPESTLTIAGQRPTPSIQALASDAEVSVTGYVSDVRSIARDCGVFIVPLRSGSGVRVKILNAMAMGLPVVSTSIGAEGLDIASGKHLLIADTPADFAKAVIDVLSNTDLAANLGTNARDLVCEKYSWDVVGKRLLELYNEKIARRLQV